MSEGSQPDPTPESDPAPATPPAEGEGQQQDPEGSQEPQGRTPEEIEAIWRNRVAGKDRAHSAEVTTLRQQLEAERRQREALEQERQSRNAGDLSEAEQWKQRAEAAEQRAQRIEQQRIIDVRLAKYPAAAEVLDEKVLASMDEAKVAALHARLSDGEPSPPPPVDPNQAPKRSSAPPAGPRERTAEELESDLKKYEGEFINTLPG